MFVAQTLLDAILIRSLSTHETQQIVLSRQTLTDGNYTLFLSAHRSERKNVLVEEMGCRYSCLCRLHGTFLIP